MTNLKIEDTHPSGETLLKYADGELKARQATRIRTHLETCWTCRAQLDKIQEAISLFVDFRRTIQMPLMAPPPSNWNDFDGKLAVLAAENGIEKNGRRNRLLSWQRFFNFSEVSNFSPVWMRAFVGSIVAMLLIVALIFQLVTVQTVSASELLEKSIATQTEQIGATVQAVVYQKLQVKRQNAPAVKWEIWQDTTHQRYRQLVSYSTAGDENVEKTKTDTLRDISEIMRTNGMDPQHPLSATSFRVWRDSLSDKTDEVSRGESETGSKFLSLKTVNRATTNAGQISEAVLKVRESDWHPIAKTLLVKTPIGEDIYELTELEFQVNSLSAYSPEFFNEPTAPQVAVVAPKVDPSPAVSESPSPLANTKPSPAEIIKPETTAPKVFATTDLEVEVLRLLNQAQADLGEQITVQRETDGLLYVRGIVETPQRKNEILGALESVKNNPAVRLEISTVAEAIAKEKNNQQQPKQIESVETQSMVIAAENDLIERLGSAEAAHSFAGQTVNLSARGLNRAFALKRLVAQFKPEELRQMSPEARAKLLALVRQHAAAFQQDIQNLRGKLKQVFDEPNVSASAVMNIGDITDVPRAIEELLELASINDRAVRSAMTVSAGNTQLTVIKTAQFWKSLKTAEGLAAKLQGVK